MYFQWEKVPEEEVCFEETVIFEKVPGSVMEHQKIFHKKTELMPVKPYFRNNTTFLVDMIQNTKLVY